MFIRTNCFQCGKPIGFLYVQNPGEHVGDLSPSGKYLCPSCYDKAAAEVPETVSVRCKSCGGTGRIKGYVCQTCDGKGQYDEPTGFTMLSLFGRGDYLS